MQYRAIPTPLALHPGYVGMFTRAQAFGAYPNGTRIMKTALEGGDKHAIGSLATVLGSMDLSPYGLLYFVEWDGEPGVAIAVIDSKIKRAQ